MKMNFEMMTKIQLMFIIEVLSILDKQKIISMVFLNVYYLIDLSNELVKVMILCFFYLFLIQKTLVIQIVAINSFTD
jgi:hypothetical protein